MRVEQAAHHEFTARVDESDDHPRSFEAERRRDKDEREVVSGIRLHEAAEVTATPRLGVLARPHSRTRAKDTRGRHDCFQRGRLSKNASQETPMLRAPSRGHFQWL